MTFRQLLEKKGYTVQMLADKCGLSLGTVYHYTSGRSVPEAPNLLKISEVLKVSEATVLKSIREVRIKTENTNTPK